MSSGKSVLLIDDCQTHAFFVERAFGKIGDFVIPVPSGERGVEHLARCVGAFPVPDLVLVDRYMPGGMDGFETLRRIRDFERLADLPVVMITGSDDPEHVAQARAAGADWYMVKPVEQHHYAEFALLLNGWNPAEGWRRKDCLRFSCVPGALAVPLVDAKAVDVPAFATDQVLATFSAGCAHAQITAARALNLRETDSILDRKRRKVVHYLMAAGWSDLEIGDWLPFSKRYFQDRRAEVRGQPQLSCGPGALLLK